MRSLLRRLICRLKGEHFLTLHFEPERLSVECDDCQFQSVGWDVGALPDRSVVVPFRRDRPLVLERLPNGLKVWRQ